MPFSVSRATIDRFASLKALRRQPTVPRSEHETEFEENQVLEGSLRRDLGTAIGSDRLALILGASVKQNRHGEHLSVHCWHGGHAPCAPDAAALRLLAPDAPEEVVDVQQWLFLDTETTGLMFNGKSFDWPLLETRYRMTRSMTPPALRAHLDCLHPARNLWRLRLGSVRLSQLERQVLGWDRGADLVSELIPRIYLDFVRHGYADPLVPVFQHNQSDLRGLAGLSSRILSLLGEESSSQDGLELYGVSRMCERRGEVKRARRMYEQSIASTLPVETDRAARTALARLAKRDGEVDLARELWECVLGNSREGYKAYEQLAIHLEHKAREPRRALGIVRDALAQLRRANQLGTIGSAAYRRSKARFEHRLGRLERKAGQILLEAFDA